MQYMQGAPYLLEALRLKLGEGAKILYNIRQESISVGSQDVGKDLPNLQARFIVKLQPPAAGNYKKVPALTKTEGEFMHRCQMIEVTI